MLKMSGSKWDQVLHELSKFLKETLIKINREDIVTFCLENETTRSAAEIFLKTHKKLCGKDSSFAARKKEEGNEKYKKKQFQESVDLYTESIFYSCKGDECLPLAYANRALALQQMSRPLQSLTDIDSALENGYPKNKSHVLILRKAKCLVQLGDAGKAREILNRALNNAEKNEISNLIQQELEKIKNIRSQRDSSDEKKLPKVAGGENKNFVSASEYLNVHYERNKGRHVVANRDIEVGDVLFVEKPFAFVLLKKGCHNCLKDIDAPIPCWNCLDVTYCSPKCRDDFWESYHCFECGFANLFKSVGIAHLSIRIVLKASSNFDELKCILKNLSEPEYENGTVLYKSKGYDSVYNLVHNSDKYEVNDLFQYAMTALLLSLYLKNYTNYFPEKSDDSDLRLMSSVLLRHILQLICNGHAIPCIESNNDEHRAVVGVSEVRIGTAIYPSASMMNHSCESSIINTFQNNCLIVRAARRIRKGEEVFNCYGPDARRMKKDERLEILSKQYFFNCQCEACVSEFDIQEKFTAFKCTSCKGPSIPNGKNSKSTICLDCGQVYNVSAELLSKHTKFYSLIKKGELLLLNDNVISALKTFLEGWWLGREIFYKFHKDLCCAADLIARCLATLEDFRRSILFLKCSVRSVEERFGSCSIEYADEMKKLGDVITAYSLKSKQSDFVPQGMSCYRNAQEIMKLLYGPQCKELEAIERSELLLKLKFI